jgi:branched-chain amino acid transport system ATP-binding protein
MDQQNCKETAMLSIKGLHAGYEGAEVLRGVNLVLERGETVAILGANGAGKTTLLMTISGIIPIAKGEIEINGLSIYGLKAGEITRKGVAHVPEGRLIFPGLTVAENLSLTARIQFSRKIANQEVEQVLALFPMLRDRYRVLGGVLSGGEQQLLAIARALVTRPELLMLDEPSLGLAPSISDQVFDVLARIKSDGRTILLVEQNVELALELASRVYVMESGRVMLSESADLTSAKSRIADAYLGDH